MVFFTSPDATTLTAPPSLWLLPTGGIQHLHAVLSTNIQRERTQRQLCYFLSQIGHCKHTLSGSGTMHYTLKSIAQVDFVNKSRFLTVCHFPL